MPRTSGITRKHKKIAAITAGALVVGLGATYTLASWTDTEWVWGGSGNTPGTPSVGSDSFAIEQSVDPGLAASSWRDGATEGTAGELIFSPGALTLSPGDTITAAMSLRTKAGSGAGTVSLTGAKSALAASATNHVPLDPPSANSLWDVLTYDVYTTATADISTCGTGDLTAAGWTKVNLAETSTLTTGSSKLGDGTAAPIADNDHVLSAGANATTAGAAQHYCFRISFPTVLNGSGSTTANTNLMGKTVAPAWRFDAVSS